MTPEKPDPRTPYKCQKYSIYNKHLPSTDKFGHFCSTNNHFRHTTCQKLELTDKSVLYILRKNLVSQKRLVIEQNRSRFGSSTFFLGGVQNTFDC